MPRTVLQALGLGLLALGLLVLGGIGSPVRTGETRPATVTSRTAADLRDAPVVASQTITEVISALQARLKAVPADWESLASLGQAYVQYARITADPSSYPKAEAVLRRSLALHPEENFEALTGLGALALARHDFSSALEFGRQAAAINPHNANAHGVIGDALVELGRYSSAFDEFQRMVDLRPGLSSYARASYARELQGDVPGAIEIMKLALEASGTPQDRAWTYNQVGDLWFNSGNLRKAEHSYSMALGWDESFLPPQAGLGRVAAARGRVEEAIERYREVVAVYPLPEYVIVLGDLYQVQGDRASAAQQFDLVRAEEQLFRSNGVNVDLEIALFNADHRSDVRAGLAAARREWRRRHSIHVADALAWALHAAGRDREALPYANRALRLGTRNALFLFHRGMIERGLGQNEAARRDLEEALAINPHFSVLWSAKAAEVLEDLKEPA